MVVKPNLDHGLGDQSLIYFKKKSKQCYFNHFKKNQQVKGWVLIGLGSS
jgi:hypothetical protein